jgi:hypothetical protein
VVHEQHNPARREHQDEQQSHDPAHEAHDTRDSSRLMPVAHAARPRGRAPRFERLGRAPRAHAAAG